jgi:glucose 1-dehydrogenase
MRAVVVTPEQAGSARLADVPAPRPADGEALVRVVRAGACGTDAEIDHGLFGRAPPGDDYLILGHENLGRVERGAGPLEVGDLVVSTVRRPDGCLNCRAGESDMCLDGGYTERGIIGRHGFWAESYAESPDFLVRLPPELESVGVLLEPTSVVEKAIRQSYALQRRLVWEPKQAVVLGAGPIGLLSTVALRLRGLAVTTVARSKGHLAAELVTACGGRYLSSRDVPIPRLGEELGRLDLIVEATGNGQVVFEAMQALGTNGVLCLTSITGGHRPLEVDAHALNLRLVLGNMAVFGSVNAHRADFEQGVADLVAAERRWPGLLDRLITRRLGLDGFRAALDASPGDIKTVLAIE